MKKTHPRKVAWTSVYRRVNKKGLITTSKKKKVRKIQKPPRAIVGLSQDQLLAKRNQTKEVRQAARDAATRYFSFYLSSIEL